MKRFMLIAVALTCTPLGARGQQATTPITFSEYPVGTGISAQYRDRGLLFGGSSPFISTDRSNPTSPVLSGTPRFQGAITGTFVEPGTDRPAIVESFTFDAGYFDEIGSTRIQWFDPHGAVLGQRINSRHGIEPLRCEGGNIASWRIEIVANEPAGYAIDNVIYVPAGPSILFRERSDDQKDGTWGRRDEIPGWDHSALQIDGAVYESHPGYAAGTYVSADGQESRSVVPLNGVQPLRGRGRATTGPPARAATTPRPRRATAVTTTAGPSPARSRRRPSPLVSRSP